MNLKKGFAAVRCCSGVRVLCRIAGPARYLAIGVGVPVYRPIPYYGPMPARTSPIDTGHTCRW